MQEMRGKRSWGLGGDGMRSAGRAGTLTRFKVASFLGQTRVYLKAPLHLTLWFKYISEPISTRLAEVLI